MRFLLIGALLCATALRGAQNELRFNEEVVDAETGISAILMPIDNTAAVAVLGGTPTQYLIVSVKDDKAEKYVVQVSTQKALYTAIAYKRYSDIHYASAVFVLPPREVVKVEIAGMQYTTAPVVVTATGSPAITQ